VLDEAPGEAARLAMLMGHYRDPLDWTVDRLQQAKQGLDRFYLALRGAGEAAPGAIAPRVMAALEDDLNTPLAIAVLHELLAELNKATSSEEKRRLKAELLASGAVMGLLQQDPEAWLKGGRDDAAAIEAAIAARNAARKARNFAEADRIRTELALKGILLEDGPTGTTWRRAG
jgi:cysteinyl-tRNA synthetase